MSIVNRTATSLCGAGLAAALLASSSAAAQSIKEHFFGNSIEAGVIAIDGPMSVGLTDRLQAMIASEGVEARRVLLNSPGGSLLEGIRLGQLIRERGYSTEVGRLENDRTDHPMGKVLARGECLSACALAFLGGSHRQPESAPFLGFHQFHEDGAAYSGYQLSRSEVRAEGLSHAQVVSGLVVSYMVEMGADARLFAASALAGPSNLIRLTTEEAVAYGVVTPRPFGAWALEPYGAGVVAISKRVVATGPHDLATLSAAFCRPPAKPSLIVTVENPGGLSANDLAEYAMRVTTVPRSDAPELTATVSADQMQVFGRSKDLQIEVSLSDELKSAIAGADAFGFVLLAPRALGGYSVSHVLSNEDRAMIDAAFRLCI